MITCLDIRVGNLTNPREHPTADKLYIEDIDCGEEVPRQICSGLVNFIPKDKMSGLCLVVTNLKARKMQGQDSNGMVLAAMSKDGTQVELLRPPAGAVLGERVSFEGLPQGTAATPNQLNKQGKKALEAILTGGELVVNSDCEASWRGRTMVTKAGPVKASLAGATIK